MGDGKALKEESNAAYRMAQDVLRRSKSQLGRLRRERKRAQLPAWSRSARCRAQVTKRTKPSGKPSKLTEKLWDVVTKNAEAMMNEYGAKPAAGKPMDDDGSDMNEDDRSNHSGSG